MSGKWKKVKLIWLLDRKDITSTIGTLLSILLKKNSDISAEENETSENTQQLSKVAS